MSDPGGGPTSMSRAVVTVVALLAVAAATAWIWSTATGVLVAGVPAWAVGLVVVALTVALAFVIHRAAEDR